MREDTMWLSCPKLTEHSYYIKRSFTIKLTIVRVRKQERGANSFRLDATGHTLSCFLDNVIEISFVNRYSNDIMVDPLVLSSLSKEPEKERVSMSMSTDTKHEATLCNRLIAILSKRIRMMIDVIHRQVDVLLDSQVELTIAVYRIDRWTSPTPLN